MLNLGPDAGAHVWEGGPRRAAADSADAGEVVLTHAHVTAEAQPARLLHGLHEDQLGGHTLGHGLVVNDGREVTDRRRTASGKRTRIAVARLIPGVFHLIDDLGARGGGCTHDEALTGGVRHGGTAIGRTRGRWSTATIRIAQPRAGGREVGCAALNGDRAGRHSTRVRVQPVPGAIEEPTGAHRAGGLHVVPGAADLDPAGHHGAVPVQVVPRAAVEEPAGDHLTIGPHVVPAVIILSQLPAGEHARVVFEEIPGAADVGPTDSCRAVGTQPVPVVTVLEPAGGHDTVGAEEVPGAAVLHPSSGHIAVGTQVVPLAVFLLPTRHHGGGVVEEVAASIDRGPAADRPLVGTRPVPAAAGGEPAGLSGAIGDEAPGVAVCAPGALAQAVRLGDAGGIGDAE